MTKNHKLSEVKAQQITLENAITALIQQFEEETSLRITEVRVGRVLNAVPITKTVSEIITTAKVVIIL